MKNNWFIYKSIRKEAVPPTRIERPSKGKGHYYKRPKNKSELIYGEE